MKVRHATLSDLDAIIRIDHGSDGAVHWRREDYEVMVARSSDWLLVVEDEPATPAGFLATRLAADEAEILNLAVDPARRRRGAGRALVEQAARLARERGAERLYLEVRASNQPARAFYLANRFVEFSRRANYYEHPREDAVVLVRKLSQPD